MKPINLNLTLALVAALILTSPHQASAHESDREAQLKATNDELTTRVAELLQENKRLQEFAMEALIANSNKEKIVPGCDTQQLRKSMVTGRDSPSTVQQWLDKNGERCTKEQLQYLLENLASWSSYTQIGPVRYIRFLMDN